MLCAMLVGGQPTGETSAVMVCEVRRDGRTQEVQSVRVMTAKNKRELWVQPQYLSPVKGDDSEYKGRRLALTWALWAGPAPFEARQHPDSSIS